MATATAYVHEDREISRTRLLERVGAGKPAILSLIAPAGFGKTTFARQLLKDLPAFALCDCRGIDSDLEFARRILPALADEAPERAAGLSQNESMLRDDPNTGDRIPIALSAWRLTVRPSAFVFENAEEIFENAPARNFFARLLTDRPDNRTIIICSREQPRMYLSRFAPPHRILTLRAAELAFTREEVEQLFTATPISPQALERVAAISSGWPIAVLLLLRFAREERLEHLLEKLNDVAFESLYEYLADQVLGSLPPTVLEAIIACTAIPQATLHDITAHTDQKTAEHFTEAARFPPFITRSEMETYAVHPFLATLLTQRYPHRIAGVLEQAARRYEASGDWQRASELHLARGDRSSAARALNEYEVIEDHVPPITYTRMLASLDHATIVRYPRLWAANALLRAFSTDMRTLLREAEDLWVSLPMETTSPIIRMYVFIFRVLSMSYLGDFERALQLIDEFRATIFMPTTPQTKMHGRLLFLRALMTARTGRLSEAEHDLQTALPLVGSMYIMNSSALATMGGDIARLRGERERERTLLEQSLEIAHTSGLNNFVAFHEAEAAFGAWFAGEQADYLRHASALEAEIEREGVNGLAFFSACTQHRMREVTGVDLPRYVTCGYLIACCNAEDRTEAYAFAQESARFAEQYRSPFLEALTAIARAELGPSDAYEATFAQAERCAERIDSEPFRQAVLGVKEKSDPGFLRVFIDLLRRGRDMNHAENDVIIELLTGKIRRGNQDIALPERESALLFACAIRPEVLPRERLTEQLWPDLSDTAARNAFHVCLHRLKRHLQQDIIIHTKNGYRLSGEVRVDLWEIERATTSLHTHEPLDDAQATSLRQLFERLAAAQPTHFEKWEWLAATERRVSELRAEIAHTLARHALVTKRENDALSLSHTLIGHDPYDESAHEIAISAHLSMGNSAAALRHFRRYRETLKADLDCEPSSRLTLLIDVKA